jgi:glycosyltransferase involved in cell wall biosynthesis
VQVSVVIPTFNRARTLPRALDSVLGQTLAATEVIVVDDGSQDGSAELIATRYPQVRYLRLPNGGVSRARNRGIEASRGEWIALLDSDDAWLPGKLAAQSAALGARPKVRLCHTEEIWIRRGRRVNQMDKHAKSGGRIFRACLPRCVISPSSALLHRSLFDELGAFDEDLPACEDYDLWLRVCAAEPVAFVPTPQIHKHGGHDDQLSRQHWGMDRFRIRALEKIIDSGRLASGDRAAACEVLIRKAEILAAGARKRGYLERAAYYETKRDRYLAAPG